MPLPTLDHMDREGKGPGDQKEQQDAEEQGRGMQRLRIPHFEGYIRCQGANGLKQAPGKFGAVSRNHQDHHRLAERPPEAEQTGGGDGRTHGRQRHAEACKS